ncbi:hypothetical protein CASFOL_037732 [Castilleja foliolosa]|uniref:Uncharacterized protein n=1 Tax=Castilleja foliolosa TaxID=1961234 RepID=A0ABD3BK57_9LAMI
MVVRHHLRKDDADYNRFSDDDQPRFGTGYVVAQAITDAASMVVRHHLRKDDADYNRSPDDDQPRFGTEDAVAQAITNAAMMTACHFAGPVLDQHHL